MSVSNQMCEPQDQECSVRSPVPELATQKLDRGSAAVDRRVPGLCCRGCSGDMFGLRLHNFEVVAQIGEGAMGTVWFAWNALLGRRAAIKFLRPELVCTDWERRLSLRFVSKIAP